MKGVHHMILNRQVFYAFTVAVVHVCFVKEYFGVNDRAQYAAESVDQSVRISRAIRQGQEKGQGQTRKGRRNRMYMQLIQFVKTYNKSTRIFSLRFQEFHAERSPNRIANSNVIPRICMKRNVSLHIDLRV